MRLPSIPLFFLRLAPACLLLIAAAAPGSAQSFDPGENSCDGKAEDSACWMEIANHPQCYLWSHGLQLTQSVTWSGTCRAGLADGRGTATWTTEIDEWIVFETGVMLSGHRRGQWVEVVITGDEGEVTLSKGPYGADGERTGNWIRRWSDSEIGEGTFVDGEWQGGERPGPDTAEGQLAGPEGPICTGDYSPDSCWMEIAGRPGCYLWNPFPQDEETVTWNGGCSDGVAQGIGRTTWYEHHEVTQMWEGRRAEGKGEGWAFGRGFGDDAFLTEACYVNDERRDGGVDGYERTIRLGYSWTWDFSFAAGERVVINMKSDDLDSYLEVLRADGTVVASNDDGGSGANARLVFEAPMAGDYKIRARGYDDDDSGTFELWVGDRDPGTTAPGVACDTRDRNIGFRVERVVGGQR